MTHTKPVRVILFYFDPNGKPITAHDYPDEFRFEDLVFAEEVTSELVVANLLEALGPIQFPDGTSISWTAIDNLPDNMVH